ncbi:MAG: hypothetical protein ACRD21_26490, partial [Vicinamibacteria bacterium]
MMRDYKSGRLVVLGLLLFAAALAVIALVGRPRISLRTQSPPSQPTLAVLPFRNLSGEPELEIVASDLAIAISDALADTGRVSLVPDARIAGVELDREGIEEAARSLGADYVITGTLDDEAGLTVVDAYLFRAGPEPGLWVERFERDSSERSSLAADL